MDLVDAQRSKLLGGCILDEPNFDRYAPELHHVYCYERKAIFVLTKALYEKTFEQVNRSRPDGWKRFTEKGLKFGTCIDFNVNRDNQITSFKLANKWLDTDIIDGKNVFQTLCVFNREFTKVFTEDFDILNVNYDEIMALNSIPNSNVAIEMYIEWESEGRTLLPKIFKLGGLAADCQQFVAQAKWNAGSNMEVHDNEFDHEIRVIESANTDPKVVTDKEGFITGLTSIFVPDLFSYSVILPSHNKKFHSIGRFAKCSLVYNEVRKSYVAYQLEPLQSAITYNYMLSRKSDSVEGIFDVDLKIDECLHGLYKHKFFHLIADPLGFLDLVRFCQDSDETKKELRTFKVPIKDRLSKTNEHQTTQDLDIITRFEVTSPGDDGTQLELINHLNNKEASLEGGGVVINKDTGLVCAHHFSGIVFNLCGQHDYENGTPIVFKAMRIVDMDITRPTFLITTHKRKRLSEVDLPCTFVDGKFRLKAKFNTYLNCYEALNMFGYIPCRVPPPNTDPRTAKDGKLVDRIYQIKAEENINSPSQTVLFHGEFVREL